MNWVIGGIITLIVALGGVYYVGMQSNDTTVKESGDTMMEKNDAMTGDAMMEKDAAIEGAMMEGETMMQKGSYQEYSAEKLALANEGKVLLYFHADWCPICRPLDAAFKANEAALGNVTILKVNFDTATSLKQKYGVTLQHTFVQVDASGNMIAKWSDARDLAGVLAKVQ